jgi:hypothetical protein
VEKVLGDHHLPLGRGDISVEQLEVLGAAFHAIFDAVTETGVLR